MAGDYHTAIIMMTKEGVAVLGLSLIAPDNTPETGDLHPNSSIRFSPSSKLKLAPAAALRHKHGNRLAILAFSRHRHVIRLERDPWVVGLAMVTTSWSSVGTVLRHRPRVAIQSTQARPWALMPPSRPSAIPLTLVSSSTEPKGRRATICSARAGPIS